MDEESLKRLNQIEVRLDRLEKEKRDDRIEDMATLLTSEANKKGVNIVNLGR